MGLYQERKWSTRAHGAHGDEFASKEVFMCTKLRAHKSIKTPLSSAKCI